MHNYVGNWSIFFIVNKQDKILIEVEISVEKRVK